MAIEVLKNPDALLNAVERFRKYKSHRSHDLPLMKEIATDLLQEVTNEVSDVLPFDKDFSLEMSGVIDNVKYEIDAQIEEEANDDGSDYLYQNAVGK